MQKLSPGDFETIFRARYATCLELLSLSRQQQPLIEQNHLSRLLEVLSKKQEVIEQMAQLLQEIPDFWEQWKLWKTSAAQSEWNNCQELLQKTEQLLAGVLQQEQTSTETLESKRDETQQELQAIASGSEVHDAYQSNLPERTHRRIDINQ